MRGHRLRSRWAPEAYFQHLRKMQRKGLSFEQLYDISAVRVLVDSIADCYAALGIVHSLWPYIPVSSTTTRHSKDNLYGHCIPR